LIGSFLILTKREVSIIFSSAKIWIESIKGRRGGFLIQTSKEIPLFRPFLVLLKAFYNLKTLKKTYLSSERGKGGRLEVQKSVLTPDFCRRKYDEPFPNILSGTNGDLSINTKNII